MLTIRGTGKITDGERYFLGAGNLKGLVPVFFYEEGFSHVFTYDLETGYSLQELKERGEGLVTLEIVVDIMERCLFMADQYFLSMEHFVIHEETILMNWEGRELSLVYAPPWEVPFLDSVIELVHTFFQKGRLV